MNVNNSTLPAANIGDGVGLSILKKAIDIEAKSAMALINSIPQPTQQSANLPPNLGQNVNTTA